VPDHKGLPILAFASQERWRAWLDKHATAAPGIWLKFAKQSSGVPSVKKKEAIEVALSYGWIDGQLDKFDEKFWLVRFTRRGPKSKWSQINRDTAIKLLAEGRITPAGLAEIEEAKMDGRWDAAYAPQKTAEVPADLQVALNAKPAAKAFFATLRGANRYAVLYRIHDAKTAKTRGERIRKFVSMLALKKTVFPANN
jgi:uncharacterized protein YdeI (YjbR/CyaY-like superfamily)